jgi:hypothetical protein
MNSNPADGTCNPDSARDVVLIAACRNGDGNPDFAVVVVHCTQDSVRSGLHYDEAALLLEDAGYEEPFVFFDENNAPDWLKANVTRRIARDGVPAVAV